MMPRASRNGVRPDEEFGHEVSQTRALISQYLVSELAGRGLGNLAPSHGDILARLLGSGAVRMSELSRSIGRDPSTTTALVRKLVALGFAETHKCPVDRRATEVSLTPRGEELKGVFLEVSHRFQATWHDGVDPEDLVVASRVLARMRENLRRAIAAVGGDAAPTFPPSSPGGPPSARPRSPRPGDPSTMVPAGGVPVPDSSAKR